MLLALLAACTNDGGITKHNASPTATILSPADGAALVEGALTTLRGQASDPDDGATSLRARWLVDGVVVCDDATPAEDGSTSCELDVPAVASVVELDVYDPDDAVGTATVSVTVSPSGSPVVSIEAPLADGIYYADRLVTLEGLVADPEDPPEALAVAWVSTLDGTLDVVAVPTSDGHVLGAVSLSAGEHFLTLTATDTDGKTGQAGVDILVRGPNTAPACAILAPADGSVGPVGATVLLTGTASDADVDPTSLTAAWSSDRDGALGTVTPSGDGSIQLPWSSLSAGTHTLTLSVTDEVGAECVDAVRYLVDSAPTIAVAAPRDGDVYGRDAAVAFSAAVADAEDAAPTLTVTWDDDVEGRLAAGPPDATGLSALDVSGLAPGEHVLTVTVTDPAGLSASATMDYRVDEPPGEPRVSISPTSPVTADALVAHLDAAAVDPEGDAITYTWAWDVDGAPSAASTSEMLPASATARGETWTVHVYASDAWGDGPEATASVTIGDTAPTVSTVTITPASPTEDDTLACAWSGFADADGDSDVTRLEWAVNGTAAGSGASLAGVFLEGDTVMCTVTPSDGTLDGTPIAAAVVIGGSAPTGDCPVGNCAVRFDGSDSYITVPDDPTLDGGGRPLTVEAWVWYDDINRGCMTTVRKGTASSPTYDYWLHKNISPADSLFWGSNTGYTALAFGAVSSGRWYHYAGVYDPAGAQARIYIDGHLVSSTGTYAAPTANDDSLLIGWDWDGGCDTVGVIDEVRISAVVRYASDFSPAISFGADADTMALWHFDEYTGSTAYDDSGNGNDGTLHGVTWTTEHP